VAALAYNQASDDSLLEKLHKAHEKHQHYEKPKKRGPNFIVRHYAGDVRDHFPKDECQVCGRY
jgi:myosin heavy subunit